MKKYVKLYEEYINIEPVVNLNYEFISTWIDKPSGYEYESTEIPIDWDVDDFKYYVKEVGTSGVSHNYGSIILDDLANILGLEIGDDLPLILENGSGLFQNRSFKKYTNINAALYDIWDEIMIRFKPSSIYTGVGSINIFDFFCSYLSKDEIKQALPNIFKYDIKFLEGKDDEIGLYEYVLQNNIDIGLSDDVKDIAGAALKGNHKLR